MEAPMTHYQTHIPLSSFLTWLASKFFSLLLLLACVLTSSSACCFGASAAHPISTPIRLCSCLLIWYLCQLCQFLCLICEPAFHPNSILSINCIPAVSRLSSCVITYCRTYWRPLCHFSSDYTVTNSRDYWTGDVKKASLAFTGYATRSPQL